MVHPLPSIDLRDDHGQRFTCLPHDVIAATVSDLDALQRRLQSGVPIMAGVSWLGRRQ